MNTDDKYICIELLNAVRAILNNKEKIKPRNFPTEFAGTVSDLLYDEKVKNSSLVNVVDILSQETRNASELEILIRFELIERVLTELYSRNTN